MRAFTSLFLFVALGGLAIGQVAKAARDPKAVALLEKADAATYSPKRAGLKDLQYRQTLSNLPGILVDVRWAAPDTSKVDLGAAPDAPAHVRAMIEAAREPLTRTATLTIDMIVGKDNVATYAEDEISLASEGVVKILARSERSKAVFRENLVTFDARGLPVAMKTIDRDGRTIEMNVIFEAAGALHRVREVKSMTPVGEVTMNFEYVEIQGFAFPRRITSAGGALPSTQEFSEFKVDTGLDPATLK